MSYDIGSTTTKIVDPENVGVAVGIFSLCALELEICLGVILPCPPLPANVAKKPLLGQGLTVVCVQTRRSDDQSHLWTWIRTDLDGQY